MTKEQKIQESWGDYYEKLSEDAKEWTLNHNGWCHISLKPPRNLPREIFILHRQGFRPKSLFEIENNNGWIKFEGNLPQESNWYWIKTSDDTLMVFWVSHKNKFVDNDNRYYYNSVTYYQPILKPKPPIY